MKRSNLVSRQQSSRRRAAVAALTAITLVVLLIFASLAVDLGFVRAVCGDMQHTADGGALAGASALRESDGDDQESARASALDIIERMQKSQGFSSLDDQIIEFGTWDPLTNAFKPANAATLNPFAVRVVSVRNKTPLFFAAIMGKYSTDVTREAVALEHDPCAGIWGLQGIKNGSINTDSYNSTEGAYNALTAGQNGDLCSGRDIISSGSFNIQGDVMPGFGYGLKKNGSSGEISGYTTNNSGALPTYNVDPSVAKYTNDNATIPKTSNKKSPFKSPGNISLTGGANLALAAGTYYLESISLSGGSSITINGRVTIYLTGNMDVTGGSIVNTTANPHNLSILSSGTDFKLGSSGSFYGEIMAPYALVTLNSGSTVYGSVLGKTVDLKGNNTVHVDESLLCRVATPMPSLVK